MRSRRAAAVTATVAATIGVAAGAVACSSTPPEPPGAEPPRTEAEAEAGSGPASTCDPDLDAAFEAWAGAGFSGSIAVTTGGEPDCLAAYGLADRDRDTPNTPDTVFGLGSVSKAFAAAAVFRLVDAGELALDDRAGDVLADLTGAAADATVGQLLLHTGGITGSHGRDHHPLDRDAAVAAIGRLEPAFPPGTDFLYSNAGYTLLALIVEQASGRPYRELMTSEVLPLPAGRTAGGFWDGEPAAPGPRAVGYLDGGEPTAEMGGFAGPHWALSGNGDLAMTMADLAAWTHALFTGGIVSPASASTIQRPGFDHGDGAGEAPGWVAFDATVLGEPLLTAAGGGGDVGHDVVVVWRPEHEQVVAIASNTAEVTAEQLLDAVGPALLAGEPLPAPSPIEDVDPDAAALAGSYELDGGGTLTVADDPDAGRLVVVARGPEAVGALRPIPEDEIAPGDVRRHEEAVLALLDGRTPQGREERAAIEAAVGPIDGRELAGSVVDGGELRTYVAITSGGARALAWYSLDGEGGVSAAEIGTDPPSLVLGAVPGSDDTYGPDDPTGTGPQATLTFTDDRMTLRSPSATTVTATRSGGSGVVGGGRGAG
jgi:CubicO group peptidase (beta-lactamase class C family)